MKSFNNFYDSLPKDAQKAFKADVMKALGWNEDQFYKKRLGQTRIWKGESKKAGQGTYENESETILSIAKKYWQIFLKARALNRQVDETLNTWS